jgi:hypothetical protein
MGQNGHFKTKWSKLDKTVKIGQIGQIWTKVPFLDKMVHSRQNGHFETKWSF